MPLIGFTKLESVDVLNISQPNLPIICHLFCGNSVQNWLEKPLNAIFQTFFWTNSASCFFQKDKKLKWKKFKNKREKRENSRKIWKHPKICGKVKKCTNITEKNWKMHKIQPIQRVQTNFVQIIIHQNTRKNLKTSIVPFLWSSKILEMKGIQQNSSKIVSKIACGQDWSYFFHFIC